MSKLIYNLNDDKSAFARLVERAALGEEIILTKDGKPRARLVPFSQAAKRQPGGWEGRVRIDADFDDPPPVSET